MIDKIVSRWFDSNSSTPLRHAGSMMTDHPDFLFTKYIEKAAFDTRTSVEDKDYQVPFSFNGNIAKLEVALQP